MKLILVTGDSGGLGSAIVGKLLQYEEYNVVGTSRRTTKQTEKLRDIYGDRYRHVNFDLSRPDMIKELYFSEIKDSGPVYGLVNNAAAAYSDLITNAGIESLETMFDTNVLSAIMLTKYAIRDMLLHGTKGSIVHISSVSAHTGYKGLSMYAATKGALEAFSLGAAREWGSCGIRSNCVAAGFMETTMTQILSKEQKKRIYSRTALKSEISVESVASTVEFLLSDKSDSITGTVIHVDNGTL